MLVPGPDGCRRGGQKMLRFVRLVMASILMVTWFSSGAVKAAATQVVGQVGIHFVEEGETLLDVARAKGLGILEVMSANPSVDPWIPEAGQLILLPHRRILPDAPRRGIVINLAERRLYLFGKEGSDVQTWPIGIGRLGFKTPLGGTRVVRKKVDPTWYPTEETRADNPELPKAVPAGPDNPMGGFALYLGWPLYAIHGTNRPWGIGRHVSRGCIRLYPEDIERLYKQADVGIPVTVVDQIAKFAWYEGRLYLEIHPSRAQLESLEATGRFPQEPLEGLEDLVAEAMAGRDTLLDRDALARAERERRGVPVAITRSP